MNLRALKAPAAALLFLVAAGCTDTTVQPKSTVTDANVFSDPNSYRSFIGKVYAGLALSGQQGPAGQPDLAGLDEGFSQYLRLYWELEELPTDEAVISWGDQGLPELNTASWSSDNGFVQTMYYRIFFQVALANEFLRLTTDDELSKRGNVDAALRATIHTYRAEARFLRAFSYWHGIDLFARIPLVTAPPTLPPPQVTRDSLYRFVVSELNAIKDSLPQPGASSYGRATTMAAHMLLAELYLNAEVYNNGAANYAGAAAEAQTVIASGAYSLDPNFRHMFLADNNTSPELIFVIPQDGQKEETWGGVTFLIHASCGGSMSNSTYGIDGCWWGLRLKQQAAAFFDSTADHPPGDTRNSFVYTSGQTRSVTNISDFTKGYAAPKFQNVTSTGAPGSNFTFVDTDFPVFRLGEAYLIYAEAALRGGGSTAQALTYVNALRQRAYGSTAGNITSAQLTLPFILSERGRELLWEAHRRTDLVRYGRFTGGTYLWEWKGNTLNGAATDPHLDLYPLPAKDITANPNLTQNKGY